jgi:8-oxo-dGTP pyrophosphatase MutT (NUDIX family)
VQKSAQKSSATICGATVQYIERLDFTLAPWLWPFAECRRDAIQQFFEALRQNKPALWNGKLLLLRDARIVGAAMSGAFFETDYAAMLAAVTWDAMADGVKSCFPAAAVQSADGAFILGEMAEHTQNAGQVLLPCGSVERGDASDGRVDPFATLRRELFEETGIGADSLVAAAGWYAVGIGALLPLIKVMRAAVSAEQLRRRICANLAAQHDPEFCSIVVVRDACDLDERVPRWVSAFLQHFWDSAGRPIASSSGGAAP